LAQEQMADVAHRPGREFEEPRRPADPKWRARNGDLRSDLGPIFPVKLISHANGEPAIAQQEDGSAVATYPSGRKAVCTLCSHKSRRVSAFAYHDANFVVQSAVPSKASTRELPDGQDELQAPQKLTRHLGAMDEWGIGRFESIPENSGKRAVFEVSATHVTLQYPDGRTLRIARSTGEAVEGAVVGPVELRLNDALVVTYDVDAGVTSLTFTLQSLRHTFLIGEVWKHSSRAPAPNMLQSTTGEIFESIATPWRERVDAIAADMSQALTLRSTLRNTTSVTHNRTTRKLGETMSEPDLMATIGRAELHLVEPWSFEHTLKNRLASTNPTLSRSAIGQRMREGYRSKAAKRKVIADPPEWVKPKSLEEVSFAQLQALINTATSERPWLACLVAASWSKGAVHSSCANARAVAEAAYGQLCNSGLRFVVADLAEGPGIHSKGNHPNPFVEEYGVKEAPWLLLFNHAQLVYNGTPTTAQGGGLGFVARLRDYRQLARPRTLILEPFFKLQLETQHVLRQMHFEYDLALSIVEARRLAAEADPPYAVLVCSSEVGSMACADLIQLVRQRRSEALAVVCHDGKRIGQMEESFRSMADITGVIDRPLTKSNLERTLGNGEAVKVKYATCGMTAKALVALLENKMGGGW